MKKINIYLIRHAETNNKKMIYGHTDFHISEEGKKDTEKLALNPIWKEIEEVYITPLVRSQETADILFNKNIPRYIVPKLAEINFGDFEKTEIDEKVLNHEIYKKWLTEPETLTLPNGDNILKHAIEAKEALYKIIENTNCKNIAIISHGFTLKLLLSLLCNLDLKMFHKIEINFLGVSKISSKNGVIKVEYINSDLSNINKKINEVN